MKTLTISERKAARMLQQDIPLVSKPFTEVSAACGLTTQQLFCLLKKLSGNGILRKFGAILRHQKAGYSKNALVMWSIPSDAIDDAGRIFASLAFISHCYERKPAFQGKYNLFTMIHAQDDNISPLINRMSQLVNNGDFLILESLQEYKKTSPEYF
ncbi:MAG: Lrp/AsnC family transcriptional regulator [Deltaproteobacteria bacterium]